MSISNFYHKLNLKSPEVKNCFILRVEEYFLRKASTHPCTTRLKINKNSTFTIIEWTGGQDRLQCTKNAPTARWKDFMSSYDLEIHKGKLSQQVQNKDCTQISACPGK
jgi:hypothetical protein